MYYLDLILFSFILHFLCSVWHTMWEDIVLQILPWTKFRKHQIKLEIKKAYRNTKIHKIEKNIVEKAQFFPILYTLSVAQINFTLVIMYIN